MKFNFSILILLLIGILPCRSQSYSLSLSIPFQQDTVHDLRPTFVWNAFEMNVRISFSINVCKLEHGQSKESALISNTPIIMASPITSLSQMYPPAAPSLDSSSTYVWQIIMYDAGTPVAMSEPGLFYTPEPHKYNGLFWQLNNKNRNTTFRYDQLAFSYNNRFNLSALKLSISNISTGDIAFEGNIHLKSGVNNIVTSRIIGFPILSVGEYEVTVTTSKNEIFDFLFNKL